MSDHFTISRHAVEQYRGRALLCCERERPDAVLRDAIAKQLRERNWDLVGGETFAVKCGPLIPKAGKSWDMKVAHVTHTFIVEARVVVTTLGFGMRPAKRKKQRLKRLQRLRRLAAA